MHISDQVSAALIANGFEFNGTDFRKQIATGGVFGVSVSIIQIDSSGRWLEAVDGFGNVEKDADLRDYVDNPNGAILAVSENS